MTTTAPPLPPMPAPRPAAAGPGVRRRPAPPVRAVLALLALLAALLPLAGATPALSDAPAAGLTHEQERVVLRLVDDLCGDTWCEGDFSFQFRRFSCHEDVGTCRLRLRIAPYTDGAPRWRSRTGTVRGFTTYEQMVRTSENGWLSLQPDFSAAVSDVVVGIEAGLPTVPPGTR